MFAQLKNIYAVDSEWIGVVNQEYYGGYISWQVSGVEPVCTSVRKTYTLLHDSALRHQQYCSAVS